MTNERGAEIFLLPDFIPDNGYSSEVVLSNYSQDWRNKAWLFRRLYTSLWACT